MPDLSHQLLSDLLRSSYQGERYIVSNREENTQDTKTFHPARLLEDQDGLYGLEVDENEICRAERILTRPDKVRVLEDRFDDVPTLFHRLPVREAPWAKGSENSAAKLLGMHLAARSGVRIGQDKFSGDERRHYFAAKGRGRRIVSKLVSDLLRETVPENQLMLIRRFPPSFRGNFFRKGCELGTRFYQAVEAFPYIAFKLQDVKQEDSVSQLILRGAKLREVAAALEIPMAFRRIPPVLIRYRVWSAVFLNRPDLIAHHAPKTVPKMRAWANSVFAAYQSGDPDFASWVAKHWESIGHWRLVPEIVRNNLRDWVKASAGDKAAGSVTDDDFRKVANVMRLLGADSQALQCEWFMLNRRQDFIGRHFNSEMSAKAVLHASDEWHEHVAELQVEKYKFPPPWYQSASVLGYQIAPITDAGDLMRYAHALHNCAATYAQDISWNHCFLYVVLKAEKPVAMVELRRKDGYPVVAQIAGPCNATVDKSIERSVRSWLGERRKVEGVGSAGPVSEVEFDASVPF